MRQDVPSLFLKVLQRFKQIHKCEGALSPKLLLSSTIKKKSEMDTQDLKGMVAHVHTGVAGILHFRKYSAQHWQCRELALYHCHHLATFSHHVCYSHFNEMV